MTIFHVAIIFICALIGFGIGRGFSHADGNVGLSIGFVVGFLFILTPYPFRVIFWLFDFKKRRKMRQYDKDEKIDSDSK
jgi:hypothetical protein